MNSMTQGELRAENADETGLGTTGQDGGSCGSLGNRVASAATGQNTRLPVFNRKLRSKRQSTPISDARAETSRSVSHHVRYTICKPGSIASSRWR